MEVQLTAVTGDGAAFHFHFPSTEAFFKKSGGKTGGPPRVGRARIFLVTASRHCIEVRTYLIASARVSISNSVHSIPSSPGQHLESRHPVRLCRRLHDTPTSVPKIPGPTRPTETTRTVYCDTLSVPFSLPSAVYLSTLFPMLVSSLVLGGLENPLRRQISVQHFATGNKVFFFFS